MGYYSEVVLAMPECELSALVSQCADVEYSVFNHVDSKTWFERTDVDFHDDENDHAQKWMLVRWNHIKWNPFLNKSIRIVEDYLDEEKGPFEFLRLGEDIAVENRSYGVTNEILGVKAEIEVYI